MLPFPHGLPESKKKAARRSSYRRRFKTSRIAEVEVLEQRLVLSPGILAVGAGTGSIPQVKVFDSASGVFLYDIFPYPDFQGFGGGVRTAVADVNNDGAFDIITAPGPGAPPLIRVFSGAAPGQLLNEFFAYDPNFLGGVYVAAADFNRDGFSEIVTGAGEGGGPHVRVFGSGGFFSDFVFPQGFTGGVRVATGDVNGDTFPDLIVAAGPGGGPHVRVFSGTNGLQFADPIGNFFAYDVAFRGGVYVASGNFGGANVAAEVVTGAGEGGGPHVRIIDPFGPNPNVPAFDLNAGTTQFPFSPSFTGGVRVAAAYVDNIDGIADLIVGAGPGGGPHLMIFRGATAEVYYQFFAYDFSVTGGIFPSSGKFLVEPLRLADSGVTALASAATITADDAEFIAQAALTRLDQMGISLSQRNLLETLEFRVSDLPDDLLGLARPGMVILDRNAAGAGWFVDQTPLDDEEFDSDGLAVDPEAQERVDLFSVILHEFGHHLGLEHQDAGVLAATLAPGERRALDAHILESLFASGDELGLP